MERVIIRPVKDRLARLEDGRVVPDRGIEVTRNSYVDRQVLAGDIEMIEIEEKNAVKEKVKKFTVKSNKNEEADNDDS